MSEPRKAYYVTRLAGDKRDDYMLIRIDPPLIGQKYGRGGQDIDQVILAARFKGDTLFPPKKWPVYVHVARPLIDNPERRRRISDSELEEIAWAELYKTEEDARVKAM